MQIQNIHHTIDERQRSPYECAILNSTNNNPSDILLQLGLIDNDGLPQLLRSKNSVGQSTLQPNLNGIANGIVNSRSFGIVHMVASFLSSLGLYTGWQDDGPELGTLPPIGFLPSLLAALLDEDTKPAHSSDILNHRFYCPDKMTFSPERIRSLLTLLADKLSRIAPLREFKVLLDKQLQDKLIAWSGNDWISPFSIIERRGFKALIRLAQYIREQSESRTGSLWINTCEHLREVRLTQIEIDYRNTFITTRLNAKQMGIYYRLNIPTPPAIFAEPLPQLPAFQSLAENCVDIEDTLEYVVGN